MKLDRVFPGVFFGLLLVVLFLELKVPVDPAIRQDVTVQVCPDTEEIDYREIDLQQKYTSDSKEYFYNLLPKDTKIQLILTVEDLKKNHMESFWPGYYVLGKTRFDHPDKILINGLTQKAYNDGLMTLRHEEVHVYLNVIYPDISLVDNHGIVFQNEMLRLAKEGAFRDSW